MKKLSKKMEYEIIKRIEAIVPEVVADISVNGVYYNTDGSWDIDRKILINAPTHEHGKVIYAYINGECEKILEEYSDKLTDDKEKPQ